MHGSNAQNEFEISGADMTPADELLMLRRLSAIAAYFDAAFAGIEGIIADCSPNLTAQSWDAAQTVIQTATRSEG
jgi:hypothetical protein